MRSGRVVLASHISAVQIPISPPAASNGKVSIFQLLSLLLSAQPCKQMLDNLPLWERTQVELNKVSVLLESQRGGGGLYLTNGRGFIRTRSSHRGVRGGSGFVFHVTSGPEQPGTTADARGRLVFTPPCLITSQLSVCGRQLSELRERPKPR